MTKREKISILKKALKWLTWKHEQDEPGVCHAIGEVFTWCDDLGFLGIVLPARRHGIYGEHCWPLTAKGCRYPKKSFKERY